MIFSNVRCSPSAVACLGTVARALPPEKLPRETSGLRITEERTIQTRPPGKFGAEESMD